MGGECHPATIAAEMVYLHQQESIRQPIAGTLGPFDQTHAVGWLNIGFIPNFFEFVRRFQSVQIEVVEVHPRCLMLTHQGEGWALHR